jgi:thioredoxin-related protein
VRLFPASSAGYFIRDGGASMRFILFTSSTCKACPQMKANLKAAKMIYLETNTDSKQGQLMAKLYQVRSLPTLVIMDGVDEVKRYIGALPLGKLEGIKARYA